MVCTRLLRTRRGPAAGMLVTLVTTLLLLPVESGAQDMVGPLRLAIAPPGLLVGDYVGSQVLVVDPLTLQATGSIPVYTDATLLERGKPLSVGWMDGRLYVGEEKTGRIQVFEQTSNGGGQQGGRQLANRQNNATAGEWTQQSASLTAMPVAQPSAIVADESLGHLFVASKGEKAVLVLDGTGKLLYTIGPGSTAPLGNPQAIALDRGGQRLFVSDDGLEKCGMMGCSRFSAVQVYAYDGTPLGAINGDTGNAGYTFSRAQGVALDAAGNLYLADSYRHEVMVFTEPSANTWSLLGILGGKGAAPGQLVLPTGVATDPASPRIYVANTMRGRVEVLTLEDLVQ